MEIPKHFDGTVREYFAARLAGHNDLPMAKPQIYSRRFRDQAFRLFDDDVTDYLLTQSYGGRPKAEQIAAVMRDSTVPYTAALLRCGVTDASASRAFSRMYGNLFVQPDSGGAPADWMRRYVKALASGDYTPAAARKAAGIPKQSLHGAMTRDPQFAFLINALQRFNALTKD